MAMLQSRQLGRDFHFLVGLGDLDIRPAASPTEQPLLMERRKPKPTRKVIE